MKGELKLLNQKIDTIKSNDLWHMEKARNSIKKIIWTVGGMDFEQFIWLIKTVFMGKEDRVVKCGEDDDD